MQDTAALRSQLAIAARPRQTDPTDPDVIASAPRPTVADRPSLTVSHYCRDDRGRWVVANIDGTPYQAEV